MRGEREFAMSIRRRRLSAVLHADLTGFVRLMEGGEEQTVDHLRSAHQDIWRPAIETGGGSIINVEGDSILAEFGSPTAAIATAIDIQERMARFNDMLDEEQRLMFRIGLHLGEVIVDDEAQALYGHGVNVAARIQAMAEPGGIAVSRALRDVTETQVEHDFVDGGEHHAKNVSRPLQIYHVRQRAEASMRTTATVAPQRILRFRGADRAGKRYAFDINVDKLIVRRDGLVIGRDAGQCDVVLSHATVSRRHARLGFADGALRIEDLGSTNRTAVDGAELPPGKRRRVEVGAVVKMGEIELTLGGD
jgi:class 3 adenylate cyclase